MVALLPPSLRHLFLCELAEWDFALVAVLLARLPRLVYLNMYRSGRPDSVACLISGGPALVDVSLESCPHVQTVTVEACPLLDVKNPFC